MKCAQIGQAQSQEPHIEALWRLRPERPYYSVGVHRETNAPVADPYGVAIQPAGHEAAKNVHLLKVPQHQRCWLALMQRK